MKVLKAMSINFISSTIKIKTTNTTSTLYSYSRKSKIKCDTININKGSLISELPPIEDLRLDEHEIIFFMSLFGSFIFAKAINLGIFEFT